VLKDGQLVALQTLWSQYARRSLDVTRGNERDERLRWASENIGRQITSFKNLSVDEAAKLIDMLQLANGRQPRARSQSRARAAGTHGRRGNKSNTTEIASAADLKRIQDALTRLGWDQTRFESWLQSASSPLGQRSNIQLRTVADANRVWWALKRLLKQAGQWSPQGNR
jgi:hypothetical protein